jgi:protein SCO1
MRLRALLAAAFLALGAAPVRAEAPALRAGVFDPPRPAPEFTLQGSDGGELRLARYRGKVVILAFGFTSCPDVCPTTLGVLARARKELGAQAGDVQVVYVTVDPERDDAKRMREYLAKFDPAFVGATGSADALAAVRKEYGIASEQVAEGGGFAHSSYTYLIDRAGSLRALMPYGHVADDYVHDVRILLAN